MLEINSLSNRLNQWLKRVQVLELSDNIRKQIPENIDYDQTIKIMMSDTSPLKTVLLQEVSVEQWALKLSEVKFIIPKAKKV